MCGCHTSRLRRTRRDSTHLQAHPRDSLSVCFNPIPIASPPSTSTASRVWVGSVGLLAGTASSTRLMTRQTARVAGTRQGRRDRARHAGRVRRRLTAEGSLDGQPPCGRVTRACVDSTVCLEVPRLYARRGSAGGHKAADYLMHFLPFTGRVPAQCSASSPVAQ
jgi:hypothetical protein